MSRNGTRQSTIIAFSVLLPLSFTVQTAAETPEESCINQVECLVEEGGQLIANLTNCGGAHPHDGSGAWVYDDTPLGRDPSSGSYTATWTVVEEWAWNPDTEQCYRNSWQCTLNILSDTYELSSGQFGGGSGTWKGVPVVIDQGFCDETHAEIWGSVGFVFPFHGST